ncbi:MAG: cell division protein ZapA [Bacteroidales bacterium]|nr:cell division protein ZapA [Bacteroidales bacterium]
MDQKISIKIAGRPFNLTASSPQQEEVIRSAADAINKRLSGYTQKNPGKTMVELMSMVALNECACRIAFQREIESQKAEAEKLSGDMERYLADIEK